MNETVKGYGSFFVSFREFTETWPTLVSRKWVSHIAVLTVVTMNSSCHILSYTMPQPV